MDDKKTVYKIVGTGFVPGLPAHISIAEAEELGVAELLRAAIKNGNYLAVPASSQKEKAAPVEKEKSDG